MKSLTLVLAVFPLWAMGAPHWAFTPLLEPAVPTSHSSQWAKNEVDHFLLAQWESAGLQPAAECDKRTWLRRVSYDLIGLPPTPEEMASFLADESQEAKAKAVTRLLGSPSYGEKWGRYWLDVVRYADTAGENTDRPLVYAWRYRNWVIEALNSDLPFDEFIRWQLAGDLLAKDSANADQANAMTVATGYLAIARRFGHDVDKDMHLTYEDTIDTLGKSLLGLSLGCARCHDHKHDPISMKDYYGLYGIFQSTKFPFTGCEAKPLPRDMVEMATPKVKEAQQTWFTEKQASEAALSQAEDRVKQLVSPAKDSPSLPLAAGDLDRGKSVDLPQLGVAISQGEMLQLTILPQGDYGADSTGLEWEITEVGGQARVWNLTQDFLTDPFQDGSGMQHRDQWGNQGVWHLLDLVPEPALLTEFGKDAEKTPGLMVWKTSADCPSFVINTRAEPIHFITIDMPARSVGIHPGPNGGVAVAWQSPISGIVSLKGRVSEIDPGGNGISWQIERRPGMGAALAAQKSARQDFAKAKKAHAEVLAREPKGELALAVLDTSPTNACLQKKGEPKDLGDEVPRKMLDLFGGEVISQRESGRKALAAWLTHGPARDLLARVMVNRVWQGHFGEGLVGTPNDFGTRGQPPANQPLLDFLARRFIASGWSLKALHRDLVLSAAYPRDSANLGGASQNEAAFPRRRLTAEELRDTLLFVTGQLDQTMGGAHPFPAEASWTFTQHNPFAANYEHTKRSVYLMVQRTRRHPFLALFDAGDPNASTPTRSQSTVPTQALFFLNDPFVHKLANSWAEKLLSERLNDQSRWEVVTQRLYGRSPSAEEQAVLSQLVAETADNPSLPAERWASALRVLFGTNELLYVD